MKWSAASKNRISRRKRNKITPLRLIRQRRKLRRDSFSKCSVVPRRRRLRPKTQNITLKMSPMTLINLQNPTRLQVRMRKVATRSEERRVGEECRGVGRGEGWKER